MDIRTAEHIVNKILTDANLQIQRELGEASEREWKRFHEYNPPNERFADLYPSLKHLANSDNWDSDVDSLRKMAEAFYYFGRKDMADELGVDVPDEYGKWAGRE